MKTRVLQALGALVATTTSVEACQDIYLTFDGRVLDGMGWGIASSMDMDGDGHDDLVAGAPYGGLTHRGLAVVLSGVDASPVVGPAFGGWNDSVGSSVAGLPDFDGDGVPDFAAGDQLDAALQSTLMWLQAVPTA